MAPLFGWILFLGGCLWVNACKVPSQTLVKKTEKTIPSKQNYQGYRLQVANIKIDKKKGNQRKISCSLINTGRERVRLPYKPGITQNIVIQYDESLEFNGLMAYKNSLERALFQQKLTLGAGQIATNQKLKFNISQAQLADNKTTEEQAPKKDSKAILPSSTGIYDKDYCPDLQIDTIFVVKRSKKKVELAFKVTNYGKGPAAMFGETAELEDNVAIRAYASGTPKLSRGDLVLGGAFIESGLTDKNGILLPNESYMGSFEVDSRKKTRYMPYFILSIDDYQNLWECEERNNVKALMDKNR